MDKEGHYAEGTINRMVADRLTEFAETIRKMGGSGLGRDGGNGDRNADDGKAPPKSGDKGRHSLA
jgi:hypothetical protein